MRAVAEIINLSRKALSFWLLSVDNEKASKVKRVTMSFSEDLYDVIFERLIDELVLLEVQEGVIKGIIKYEDDEIVLPVVSEATDIVRDVVNSKEEGMTKQEFYKLYTDRVKCTERTARTHLAEALKQGKVSENGYYNLKVEKDENKQV